MTGSGSTFGFWTPDPCPLTDEQRRRASLAVCDASTDLSDAIDLLSVLGLIGDSDD